MSAVSVSCHRHAPGAYCYKDGATRASRLHVCVAQMSLEAFDSGVETCRDSNALSCVSHLTVLSEFFLCKKRKPKEHVRQFPLKVAQECGLYSNCSAGRCSNEMESIGGFAVKPATHARNQQLLLADLCGVRNIVNESFFLNQGNTAESAKMKERERERKKEREAR